MNGYQGQIRAVDQPNQCFLANQNISSLIAVASQGHYLGYISRLGIDTTPNSRVSINGQVIQIGQTGIYEVNDVYITSIFFLQDSSRNTFIDYIL